MEVPAHEKPRLDFPLLPQMTVPLENHTERRRLHPMVRSIHIFRRNVFLQKYLDRYQQPNFYF
jgi:hypothetical protein